MDRGRLGKLRALVARQRGPRLGLGPGKLIVGLGNPGGEYAGNRHNMGFWCLDRLAEKHRLRFTGKRARSLVARGRLAGEDVGLAKPQTYMNDSGVAVKQLLAEWGVPPRALLVVYDEVDLPLGTIRLRPGGGPGTHNGMRSIVESIGTQGFPRLRIGIGPPPPHHDLADYVLDDPSPDELPLLRDAVEQAVQAIELFVRQGAEAAMNRFNKQEPSSRGGPTLAAAASEGAGEASLAPTGDGSGRGSIESGL